MVYPDFETFTGMARQGNLIPVYREILGDLETPVSAYKKLRGQGCSFCWRALKEARSGAASVSWASTRP
jgi:anthranilate synthase component 1